MKKQILLFCIILSFFCASAFSKTIYGERALAGPPLSEKEKIEQLIKCIECLKDAKFIRNGSTYDAPKAAEHLRLKWKKGGSSVKTANDFINKLASESSMSGEPYYIIYNNGTKIPSKDFLNKKLKEIK